MNMKEIRLIAREKGVHPGRLRKVELVRTIQRAEGNFDCFATAYDGECDQLGCRWREDCLALSRRGAA
ncbi:SAP domain-containing protein [Inmirania thermothiophila]|uniref:SAP domain-containing protein n=1 Tax=Inmirania thermothiophila TaxID=1750597 RepID=A0A3N1Y209_9GAMM|nr:SAP domain-containing protein [Inmirania thermothiophila]ROR32873.1 hypothetical protein EDC57_2087 [Inmirania thermothiophila]